MKEQKNLLVFSNDDIYREIDIDEFEKEQVLCGNTNACDVKLRVKSTEDIVIVFRKVNDNWHIVQNEGVYYIANGIKTPRKQLVHGDTIIVKHNIHKGELLNINYFIDFKNSVENYDLEIVLDKQKDNTIGTGNDKDISIKNELLGNSSFVIRFDEGKWILCDDRTKYGVYVNGEKVEGKRVIKNNDFIVLMGYKFFFSGKKLYVSKYENDVKINNLKTNNVKIGNKLFNYPKFLRSPRMILNYPKEKVEILKAPNKQSEPNNSFLLSMIPLVGSIGLTLAFRTGSGGNSKFIYYSIGSIIISAVVSIITLIKGKKEYNEKEIKRVDRYNQYIEEKIQIIEDFTYTQKKYMEENYPTINNVYDIVENLERRLWERRDNHEDFLLVRLGTGKCEPTFEIEVPKREFKNHDDVLEEKPYEIKEKYKTINSAPIMVDFKNVGSMGVVGSNNGICDFISNTAVDITAHHSNEEVKLMFLLDDQLMNKLSWLRWLPHTWSEDKKIRLMSRNKENAQDILKGFYKLLSERAGQSRNASNNNLNIPHYIIYISNREFLDNNPIVQFIGREADLGVTFVFLYEDIAYLPKECNCIVQITVGNSGKLQYTNSSEQVIEFNYNVLSDEQYINYAKILSPIYIEGGFTADSLRNSITLFELYNIKSASQLDLNSYWSRDMIYKSMAAPLGVLSGDKVVSLDLHEKHHGPHGLVAGTTGSGKSEILQSYIASMAINFHPHDVTFIVIDFKGGGMANLFKDLPHMVGAITNIDGNQIYRSLKSIDAELKKRQRVFAEYDVNHIDSYMKLYKSGIAKTPIPHLIMVVDEFAELKSEHPDFMAKLISTARIGRSLGVHLILATQKPAGVVDNQIWSNSKFKLCLKVQTKEDSNEMLKSPLAADIVNPGRAYLQVGNNEIFELFQSAWSGATVVEDDELNITDFEISEVSLEGIRTKIFSTKDNRNSESQQTELDNIVEFIDNYCKNKNIEKLNGPWLEPLETKIYLDSIINKPLNNWMSIPIGIYDDPDNQAQDILEIDFGTKGNLFIVGSATSGKTTLLQTILVSLMRKYNPTEVNMYILDFGSRILKSLEVSPHVGGVITSDEEEKMKNFINFILKEMSRRKQLFSSVGVTSLQSYREVIDDYMPHIMIVIDNYAALSEYFNDHEDSLNTISREGSSLGITIVATASQTNAMRYKMLANFGQRIALNCNDKLEYMNVIENCRMQPTNVQGRGLTSIDKTIVEFHTALPFKGDNEVERAQKQKEFIDDLNKSWDGRRAKSIPMMPQILELSRVLLEDSELILDTMKYPVSIGISEGDIEYKHINLLEYPVISVVGKPKFGKSNFLSVVVKSLEKNSEQSQVDMYIVDSENYSLSEFKDSDNVKTYASAENEIKEMISSIYQELESRYEIINEMKSAMGKDFDMNDVLDYKPLIALIIDNGAMFTKVVSQDRELLAMFENIVNRFNDLKISIIISGGLDVFTGIPVSQASRIIKDKGVGLVFEQISNQRMFDFKTSFRHVEKTLQIGDAYFFDNGNFVCVKTPINDL